MPCLPRVGTSIISKKVSSRPVCKGRGAGWMGEARGPHGPTAELPRPPTPPLLPPITLPLGSGLLGFVHLLPEILHLFSSLRVRPRSPCFLTVFFVHPQCKLMWDMPWPLSCYLFLGMLRKTADFFFLIYQWPTHIDKLSLPCLASQFDVSS